MLISRIFYVAYEINGSQLAHGNPHSFGHFVKSTFLGSAIYLEPLNIFLYTWRFLATLESEEIHHILKTAYRFVSLFFIIVLPALFIGIYVTFVILFAKAEYLLDDGKSESAKKIYSKYLKIEDTLGYL